MAADFRLMRWTALSTDLIGLCSASDISSYDKPSKTTSKPVPQIQTKASRGFFFRSSLLLIADNKRFRITIRCSYLGTRFRKVFKQRSID